MKDEDSFRIINLRIERVKFIKKGMTPDGARNVTAVVLTLSAAVNHQQPLEIRMAANE
jgi:hypothetical protein